MRVDVGLVMRAAGGIARTSELAGAGVTRRDLEQALRTRAVQRIRIGWYGLPDLPDHVVRAHRVGGRPACATVAAASGVWMLSDPKLHIEVQSHDRRFRSQQDASIAIPVGSRSDVVVHWSPRIAGPRVGQSLPVALACMPACVGHLAAVCAIDSALHLRLVSRTELEAVADASLRTVLAACDAAAESGVETVFRLRARAAGFEFRTQVAVPGARLDFLFGNRLAVEVDGFEHHGGRAAFVADRERDAWTAALGYRTLRFTYDQVVRRWHEVESLLRLLIARGEHLERALIRNWS